MKTARDMSTAESRKFWRFIERTAGEVMKWPAWMRGKPDPSYGPSNRAKGRP